MAEAIKIQPKMSGTVKISMHLLLPTLDPMMADANPPKIAPNPNIPAAKARPW